MSEHLHNIDDFFKKTIEAHYEMPASTVWETIENNFDKNNHVQLKKKYQFLKRIAAILLLLLCGSIFFLLSKNDTTENLASKKNNEQINEIKKTTINSNTIHSSENRLANSAREKNNTKQTESTVNISKSEENYTFNEEEYLLQKAIRKNNSISPNKNAASQNKIQPKKSENVKDDNIIEANENNNYVIHKKIISKNKTTTTIINALGEENNLNEVNKLTNLKPSILLEDRINLPKINVNTKIYVPVFRKIINNDIVAASPSFNKKQHSVSATIYASPEFAFNRLEDNKPHQDRTAPPPPPSGERPRDDRDKIKREENKTTSFSAGILVNYSLTKKFTLQSGIGFISKSTEVKPKKVFAEQIENGEIKYKNNCSLGTSYINPKTGVVTNIGDSAILGITNNTVQYISFPLNILYHFQIGKFQISPMVGVAANILVKQKVSTNIEGAAQQYINTIEGVNKNYFNANIGIDFDYKIAKNISLNVMPNLRIGLNALNTNSNVKFYSNTAGLMMGVKYNF